MADYELSPASEDGPRGGTSRPVRVGLIVCLLVICIMAIVIGYLGYLVWAQRSSGPTDYVSGIVLGRCLSFTRIARPELR